MDIQEENEQFLQIDAVKKIFSEHDIHWDETSQKWQFDFSVPDVEVNYFLGAWMAWQAAKASVVEGFVLVPKEPTKDTLIEVSSVCIGDDFANLDEARNLYKAAIKEAIETREVS